MGFPLFVHRAAACRQTAERSEVRRVLIARAHRMPGNIPFIERIIFAIPPFAIIFIIF